jgi:hypothetical protein
VLSLTVLDFPRGFVSSLLPNVRSSHVMMRVHVDSDSDGRFTRPFGISFKSRSIFTSGIFIDVSTEINFFPCIFSLSNSYDMMLPWQSSQPLFRSVYSYRAPAPAVS